MPSPALLASTASTAAKTVPVVTAECATTSRGSANVQPASVDAGMQVTPPADKQTAQLLFKKAFSEVLSANFCAPT